MSLSDWVSWDPKTTYGAPGPCGQTASQAFPNQILGHDIGYSFEDTAAGNLIVLFGDTLGVQSGVTLSPDPSATKRDAAELHSERHAGRDGGG